MRRHHCSVVSGPTRSQQGVELPIAQRRRQRRCDRQPRDQRGLEGVVDVRLARPGEALWLVLAVELMEPGRSEEHTSELQSRGHLVCRLLLEKKKNVARGSG